MINNYLRKLKIFLAFTAPFWWVFSCIYLAIFLSINFDIKQQKLLNILFFIGFLVIEIYFLSIIWGLIFKWFNRQIFPTLLLFCFYLFCAGYIGIWAISLGAITNGIMP